MNYVRRYIGLFTLFLALTSALYAQNPILDGVDQRIEQHRKQNVAVTVLAPDGSTVPADTDVNIALTRHAFLFGANLFRFDDLSTQQQTDAYRRHFAEVFNYATLPFYWQFYEQQPDVTDRDHRVRVAQWCRQNSIYCKGHTLYWVLEPPWVQSRADAEARLFGRIERETRHFRGLIDYWDVLNEPVVNSQLARERGAVIAARTYDRYGTRAVIRRAFERAKRGNPDAKLILNDFVLDDRLEQIIRDAQSDNVPIDAIGIQSHMHDGYWGYQKLWDICEQFGKFGIPIHFTELTILSGRDRLPTDREQTPVQNAWHNTPDGEKKQRDQVHELYRVLFSHPSVEAISWWDFTDQNAWMGAPAGLLDHNMKPKVAFYELQSLIKNGWTTKLTKPADPKGIVEFRGFYGDYLCQVELNGRRRVAQFRIEKGGPSSLVVQLR